MQYRNYRRCDRKIDLLCYNKSMNHEVVIIGGGFGGVRTAKILSKWGGGAHITLIDKSPLHTFHPDLYEVATAHIEEPFGGHFPINFMNLRSSAAYPLEDIFFDDLNVSVLKDEVTGIDFNKRNVALKSGALKQYDYLVVAVGSETNYFNVPGLYEKAFPLKNIYDAMEIRDAVDEVFYRTPKNKKIEIVIGGGGFTGTELAAELTGYMKKLAVLHGRPQNGHSCTIVEASEMLLGGASKWAQKTAQKRLIAFGIKIMFKSAIKSVNADSVKLSDGSSLAFSVLIWTAGVQASSVTHALKNVKLEKNYCLDGDKCMRVLPQKNVFSVGDATYCIDEETGKSLPMTAYVALKEADYVAENIKKLILKQPLRECATSHRGFIIPLGGKYAILDFMGVRLTGFIPWALKQFISYKYWWSLLGAKKAWRLWNEGISIYIKND